MKFRYVAIACILACFLITPLSSLSPGVASAQEMGGQQVTNGAINVDPTQPVSFSWTPFIDTYKYQFVLARDAAMTQVVVEAEVAGTAYEYTGTLDYSTNYFWRVRAIEPAPSDWSATFSFQTEGTPAPPPSTPPLPPAGMSCAQASIGYPAASLDLSPLLLGAVLLGLVFTNRKRPSK